MKTRWILFRTLVSISLIALLGLFTSFSLTKYIITNKNINDNIESDTTLQTNYKKSLESTCAIVFSSNGNTIAKRVATIISITDTNMILLLSYYGQIVTTDKTFYFNDGQEFTVKSGSKTSFSVLSQSSDGFIYKCSLKYTSGSISIKSLVAATISNTPLAETDEIYGISTTDVSTKFFYKAYANYLLVGDIQKLSQNVTINTNSFNYILINMSPTENIVGTPIFNSNGELVTIIAYNYYNVNQGIDSILYAQEQSTFQSFITTI